MFTIRNNKNSNKLLKIAGVLSRSLAIVEFDSKGKVVWASQPALELFGYTSEPMQGAAHGDLIRSVDSPAPSLWAGIQQGNVQSASTKLSHLGGPERCFELIYMPVYEPNLGSQADGFLMIASDITEEKAKGLRGAAMIAAICRSQAVIEFKLDGTVVSANEKFLDVVGYSLEEIRGRHHSLFMPAEAKNSPEYLTFWEALKEGKYQAGEFKRIGKGGREIWIMASYNPVLDETGKPVGVVKFAADISDQKLKNADMAGQLKAMDKSQAVIEFKMDGTIITANDNFLAAVGYSLDEIQGKHHSMFLEKGDRDAVEYKEFWASLNRGQYQAAEYKRIGKGNREFYIQASYNPILDLNGNPFKVVKYAADVTRQVLARMGNERVRGMMESVAAGSEELSSSVREISEAMVKSRDSARGAVEQVTAADAHAHRLDDAAQAMSGIVELINNITGQINLLALNATIESARAGEAGRGFAVVASEVKSLANQAKAATDKISQEIDSLNNISSEVVTALNRIKQAIADVSEYVTSTAAAVEEQSTVTSEMSHNMQRAAAEAARIVNG